MQYEVQDSQGNKSWVSEDQAVSMGLIKAPTTTMGEQLNQVPIVGPMLGTMSTIGTGLAAALKTNRMSKASMDAQGQALALAKQAQTETDPNKKAALLAQSRTLSQTTGDIMTKYANTVNQGMADFGKTQSPTSIAERVKTYAPQALRTAASAASLVAPVTSGITAPATTALGQIGSATAGGAVTGAVSGLGQGNNVPIQDRLGSAVTSGVEGGLTSGALATGGQLVKGLINSPTVQQLVQSKGLDKLKISKAWANLARKSTEGKSFSNDDLINFLKNESNKYSGTDKKQFLDLIKQESINSISNDILNNVKSPVLAGDTSTNVISDLSSATNALDVRRNIPKQTFLQSVFNKPSVSDKFNLAKYAGINQQLKNIPELAKYDSYISKLAKVTKVAKPLIFSEIINKIAGNPIGNAIKTMTTSGQ